MYRTEWMDSLELSVKVPEPKTHVFRPGQVIVVEDFIQDELVIKAICAICAPDGFAYSLLVKSTNTGKYETVDPTMLMMGTSYGSSKVTL